MSITELKELVASVATTQKETALQMKDTDRRMAETDRQLKELGVQIGGLGNKFGSFTEGLSYRSVARILREKFGINDFIAPSVKVTRGGRVEEYDILAYSNGTLDKGLIVEVKSKLRREDIAQMKRKMEGIFEMMPEHRDKTFQGLVVCVSGSNELKQEVLKNGWHLAHVSDDQFELETPGDFVPKIYSAKTAE